MTEKEFGDIVLRTNDDGSMLRLKDVARIELGAKDYSFISRAAGPGVGDPRLLSDR